MEYREQTVGFGMTVCVDITFQVLRPHLKDKG